MFFIYLRYSSRNWIKSRWNWERRKWFGGILSLEDNFLYLKNMRFIWSKVKRKTWYNAYFVFFWGGRGGSVKFHSDVEEMWTHKMNFLHKKPYFYASFEAKTVIYLYAFLYKSLCMHVLNSPVYRFIEYK